MSTYNYNADYLARLTAGWNKLSFPIISGLLRRTLKAHRPQRILDFGAGCGTYAEVLAESGGVVEACDISEDCVSACHGKYSSAFILRDPADLRSESYDLIFSTEVLEHIKNYEDTLRHLQRALRPNGAILLTTTLYSTSVFTMVYQMKNAGFGPFKILRQVCDWAAGYCAAPAFRDAFVERWCFEPLGGHYHGFLKSELLHAFSKAGFAVIESEGFYALEPLQMPFLHTHTFQGLAKRTDWPVSKRSLAMFLYVVGLPLNKLLTKLGLFANNVSILAHKRPA